MMKRYRSGIGAGVVVFFVMFSVAPARADEPAVPEKAAAERAKQHFALGEGYFKSKKFDEAMLEYQRGYADKPSPVFLFNMAQCQRLLGHRDAALELYRQYIAQAPEGVGRAVAEQRIAELSQASNKEPGRQDEMKPDDESAPKRAASEEAAPATIQVAATAPVVAPAAEAPPPAPHLFAPTPIPQTAPTIAASATAPDRQQEEERPLYRRWWFWVAAAAVASGTVVAIAAASSSNRPACDPDRLCK